MLIRIFLTQQWVYRLKRGQYYRTVRLREGKSACTKKKSKFSPRFPNPSLKSGSPRLSIMWRPRVFVKAALACRARRRLQPCLMLRVCCAISNTLHQVLQASQSTHERVAVGTCTCRRSAGQQRYEPHPQGGVHHAFRRQQQGASCAQARCFQAKGSFVQACWAKVRCTQAQACCCYS